jgi:ribosomal protein S18 acetylase RimI-like enzyme
MREHEDKIRFGELDKSKIVLLGGIWLVLDIQYKMNTLDLQIYKDIRSSIMSWDMDSDTLKKALGQSICTIVAFHDDTAVGMGRVVGDGIMYYYLQDICVIPKYQFNGIGKKMVSLLIQYIKEMAPFNAQVSIGLFAAKDKEVFYEQLGFSKLPDENNGFGMRQIFNKTR